MARGRGENRRSSGARPRAAAGRVRVAAANGSAYWIRPGLLDAAARRAFTAGQCHALALAVHERTGWPIAAIIEEDEEGLAQILHLGVIAPGDRFLDALGVHDPSDLVTGETDLAEGLEPHELIALGEHPDWAVPDLATARSLVDPVLRLAEAGRQLVAHGQADCDTPAPGEELVADTPEGPVVLSAGAFTPEARQVMLGPLAYSMAEALALELGRRGVPTSDTPLGAFAADGTLVGVYADLRDGRLVNADGATSAAQVEVGCELRLGALDWDEADAMVRVGLIPGEQAVIARGFAPAVADAVLAGRSPRWDDAPADGPASGTTATG